MQRSLYKAIGQFRQHLAKPVKRCSLASMQMRLAFQTPLFLETLTEGDLGPAIDVLEGSRYPKFVNV